MARVLWLSNETPDPQGQGGQRRQFFQISSLKHAGHAVTVVSLAGLQTDDELRKISTVRRTRTHIAGRFRSPIHDSLLRRLATSPWDLVVVAHTESWPTFLPLLEKVSAPVWVDLHNVLGHQDGQQTAWWRVEEDILRRADVVSICSVQEESRVRAQHHFHTAALRLMPHGVESSEWTAVRRPAERPVVKTFGSWGWGPNRRGLDWLIREVWPHVGIDQARLEIAGSAAELPRDRLPNIDFVGRVPRLDAWLADAWAVVVPVLDGVGAPVKYLEALASRAPVISTSDGSPSHQERALLVSDDPRQWALTLRRLLHGSPPKDTTMQVDDVSWLSASDPLLSHLEGR